MSDSRPFSPEARIPPYGERATVARVSFDDLARMPAQRLARLLLDRAAEDPTLLNRLYDAVEPRQHQPSVATCASTHLHASGLDKVHSDQSSAERRIFTQIPSDQLASAPSPFDLTRTDQCGTRPLRPDQSAACRPHSRQSSSRQDLSDQPASDHHPPDKPRADHPAIVGDSPAMRRIGTLLCRFGQTNEPVLITGESGTGKELLARAIHDGSPRSRGPFVALNCAAIPAGLVASELFGHERGAFTGATARSLGQIECANGGTLFLDEIGDMPIDLQAHLLRFLQEGQIRRVGGRETINLDVRIVSATNVRLHDAIAAARFREDLFYRLNVLTLPVPPLRERPEDIMPLATQFLRAAERDFNRRIEGFAADAVAALSRYRWPGNVRELMSVIRRAVVVGDGPMITATALVGLDDRPAPASPPTVPKPGSAEERDTLLAVLERMDENVTLTAGILRVSRVTLYRMLRRHGVALKRGLAQTPTIRSPLHARG